MAAEGTTDFERAVARAMTSRFGVGGASFHVGGEAGPALTVYLGCFQRAALDRVGGYDESMVRAQDWEMNLRIRQTGGVVWFTPDMRVTYRPRHTLRALARQYHDYGRWRREVSRRHPETLSLRYLAAPVAVAGVAAGLALAGVRRGGPPARGSSALGLAAPLGYAVLNLAASAQSALTPPRLDAAGRGPAAPRLRDDARRVGPGLPARAAARRAADRRGRGLIVFRRRAPSPMTWSVVVAAPKGAAGEQWGDTWFAADLVDALNAGGGGRPRRVPRRGDRRGAGERRRRASCCAGCAACAAPRRRHLDAVGHQPPRTRRAGRAGPVRRRLRRERALARGQSDEFGVPVTPAAAGDQPAPLPPGAAEPDSGDRVLFVGSTRGEYRPAVRDAVEAGVDLSVYGVGWEEFLPPERIRGEFLANDELPAAYAAAGVVLNDHWPDMAAEGFLSNRLFDAAACGARSSPTRRPGWRTSSATACAPTRTPHELGRSCRATADDAVPGPRGAARPGRAGRARPQFRRAGRRADRAGAGAARPR